MPKCVTAACLTWKVDTRVLPKTLLSLKDIYHLKTNKKQRLPGLIRSEIFTNVPL
jgi:hypothetical protein